MLWYCRRKNVSWDEANIAECEAGKDSTMKITEPPTPYNYAYFAEPEKFAVEEEDEKKETRGRERSGSFTDVPPMNPMELQNALKGLDVKSKKRERSEWSESSEDEDGGERECYTVEMKDVLDEEEMSEEQKKKHAAFEAKRKQHYNEFQMVLEMRKRMAMEGSSSSSEDDDEEDAPPPYMSSSDDDQ